MVAVEGDYVLADTVRYDLVLCQNGLTCRRNLLTT